MPREPLLTLHRVSYSLPDGRPLLRDISESLGAETVGLIGRNGSGKTSLGRLLTRALPPDSGCIEVHTAVLMVGQDAGHAEAASLAQLAGLEAPLQALRRLAAGCANPGDTELVGDRWDLEARWQSLLQQAGLDETRHAPATLSGGERAWLRLIGAFCSDAGLLVLDEPSNHLDRRHRAWLHRALDQLRRSGRGVLLISHDRELLACVDRTLELSQGELRRYGGAWSLVEQQRGAEQAAALARLEQARTERQRTQQALRLQTERAQRKLARGARERGSGSQGKMLLDARRERAEQTQGLLSERRVQRLRTTQTQVSTAYQAVAETLQLPRLPDTGLRLADGQTSLRLEDLVAPWAWRRPLSWHAKGPVRVLLSGPNGCGKSTLLRHIGGMEAPLQGRCDTPLGVALVDQALSQLDRQRSLLAQLQTRAPTLPLSQLRHHLAQAGLGASALQGDAGRLSGGEQRRGTLLLALLQQPTPGLLLLDEPTNHLDLAAIEALEALLDSWSGALVVVSHDAAFSARLRCTHELAWADDGWCLISAPPPEPPARR